MVEFLRDRSKGCSRIIGEREILSWYKLNLPFGLMDAFAFNNDHICSWDNFAEMAQECKQYKSVDFQHE